MLAVDGHQQSVLGELLSNCADLREVASLAADIPEAHAMLEDGQVVEVAVAEATPQLIVGCDVGHGEDCL